MQCWFIATRSGRSCLFVKKISCVVVKYQFLFESVQNQLFIKQDRGQNLKRSIRFSQNVLFYNHLIERKDFLAKKINSA